MFKQKAMQWASAFDVCCCLDSNGFADRYSKFDILIAAGVKTDILASTGNAFEQLETFRKNNPGWTTGFFTYDLKNEIEELTSVNADHLQFPDLYFFVPQHLILIKGEQITILSDNVQAIVGSIEQQQLVTNSNHPDLELKSRFTKNAYLNTVGKIKEHINRGDIYVTNFCQEFYAENAVIDPLDTFLKLGTISPNPFSAFFKLRDKYIISASPERFLAKRGTQLISQPIKGTAKRHANGSEDELAKKELSGNQKEIQENVMIVDLVRNDLTRSAKKGTVKTEELFGIYSFEQVHQMISTIVCEIDESVSPVRAIKNTFPMGSMTGAPKISAMQLMERFELTKRGVYSGAAGYFDADNDFDFNVVIRTVLYNATQQYLSFQAGSAITYHADAEKEYEECLLKIKAILEALGKSA